MDCSLGGLQFRRPSVRHGASVKPTLLLVLQCDSPQLYKNRTEANLSLCISIIPLSGPFFMHSGD